MKIFILEDDFVLNQSIKESLELEGYSVDSFYDGEEALNNILNPYDLYILDINVPFTKGTEILEYIKENNINSKVLMISSILDINKIKESYKKGCYDYLKKPFDVCELILKVNSFLNLDDNLSKVILSKNVYFSLKTSELYIDDKICKLTKNEECLLELLVKNTNQVLSIDQIKDYIYGNEAKSYEAIRSMIKRLRKKLPEGILQNNYEKGYFIKKDKPL